MNSGSSLLWNLLAYMVFVVMRWKRSPKAALLALIGLVLLLLEMPIFQTFYALAPEMISRSGFTSWRKTFFFLGLINFSAMAFAFAFLLAAVFVGRDRSLT